MFFELSKLLAPATEPGNLFLIALVAASALLLVGRWRRKGAWLMVMVVAGGVVVATVPLGERIMLVLENRFPIPDRLPERVDGIVALGGVINPWVTRSRGQLAISGAVERITEFARLARDHPEAKLVFSGGSGSLEFPELKEARMVGPLFDLLGMDQNRIVLEDRARNTHENAVLTRELMQPAPDETWILVTTSYHMPRAVGCFRKQGWKIIPYPVDFIYRRDKPLGFMFDFAGGLGQLGAALHEVVGLIVYRITGRTDSLFPGPGE